MNRIEFILNLQDPEWETANVKTMSLDFIEGSEKSLSQIRQGGIDNSHLSEIQDSIVLKGQEVPITIEDSGTTNEHGQTVYKLVDGGHRYLAISKLRKKNPRNPKYWVIRAYVHPGFSSDFERVQYQHKANDHTLPSKSNGNEDASLWLTDLVHKGINGAPPNLQALFNSAGRNKTDPDGYETDLQNAVSFNFPNMGTRRRNGIVRNFLKKMPGKFKTWDGERVRSEFLQYVADTESAHLPEKYALALVREVNHVFHSAAGNCLSATASPKDKDRDVVAIVWTNKTNGRKTSDIDYDRIESIRKINELNSHNRLGRGKKLIDRVFIAPQKLDDNEEEGFYEVLLTGNNKFSLSIPTKGWDTTQAVSENELAAK